MSDGRSISFGPFRLSLAERLLLENGAPVEIGSRALEILLVLVQRAGELVSKDELIASVWPNTHVEEVNLRVHVSALRRAIGEGRLGRRYLLTVPGRGYRFVGTADEAVLRPVGTASRKLPEPLAGLIGRKEMVQAILLQLQQRRSVTIVGPGGIGKTAIALSVAHMLRADFADELCFVDLSLVSDDDMVAGAIARALGLSLYASDVAPGILAFLGSRRRLLLLDSCDRVVEGVGALVERMLKEAPGVQVLATSREPLHAEGERVLRLPPLGVPPAEAALSAAELLQYPAVQLFVERAAAALDGFRLTEANALVTADICVRLDGIPLAIELVAGHVASVDLTTLSAMLDDRFRLLARGRRGAMRRHQTMRAVLDWSYETIGGPGRLLLRRLAVFDGPAPLAAIRDVAGGEVAGGDALTCGDVVAALADLGDKSLVGTRIEGPRVCYRLLDTTRAYALERLIESGEWREVAHRHARHYLSAFAAADRDWCAESTAEWLGTHGRDVSNARAALEFAFSADGDPALAILLAACVLPIMFELSLAEECRRWAARALALLADAETPDHRVELRLRATLAAAQMYTPGPTAQTARDWERVLEIATGLDNRPSQARAVWGLWTAAIYGGRAREAAAYAAHYAELSEQQNHGAMKLLGQRIIGVSAAALGQLEFARDRLEYMVSRYVPSSHRWKTLGFVIDHSVMAKATLARVLWLQGNPGRGWELAKAAAAAAQSHAISHGYVLIEAVLPLAFMLRDEEAVAQGVRQLRGLADQNGLAIWKAAVRVLWLASRLAAGASVPVPSLQDSLAALSATGYEAHHGWLCSVIAEALGAQGQTEAALRFADAALARCERTGEAWIVPELLRVRSEILWERNGQVADLVRASKLAREQGALAWEGRISASLARRGTAELRDARAALQASRA